LSVSSAAVEIADGLSGGRGGRAAAADSAASAAGGSISPRRLTVLSGPSGVGKSTVVAEIRRAHPEVWLSVSVTTRAPRPGEIHGVHYFFVDDAEFDRLIEEEELLEWAEFAGNRYGTPRRAVLERLAASVPALLEIDLQGARQVRAAMPEAQLVFLAPPSWEELVRRLVGRGTESPEVIEHRLAAARSELAAETEFDLTLVNTSVQDVCRELIALLVVHPSDSD
jgi:guanylate kinase